MSSKLPSRMILFNWSVFNISAHKEGSFLLKLDSTTYKSLWTLHLHATYRLRWFEQVGHTDEDNCMTTKSDLARLRELIRKRKT